MSGPVVLVTGAAGFLGSAATVELARDHRVVAVDRRKPTSALVEAAPHVAWHQADIADLPTLASVFARTGRTLGRIDVVVHLAAYYHFGADWRREYQRTNMEGTANVLRVAAESGTRRVVFASSMGAMEPPEPGAVLTERSATAGYIPYAASKSVCEGLVRDSAIHLPAVVLRIGGTFSDWCELPPLYALIRLWAGRSPLRHVVVGQGRTGFPFIHRHDVVRLLRRCVERHDAWNRYEVFLASQNGAVLHHQLFSAIRRCGGASAGAGPVHVSRAVARLGLYLRLALGGITGNLPYERPWMLQYIDRPWVADTSYTESKLGPCCSQGMGLLDRLPAILHHFRHERPLWERRNRMRNRRQYAYYASEP